MLFRSIATGFKPLKKNVTDEPEPTEPTNPNNQTKPSESTNPTEPTNGQGQTQVNQPLRTALLHLVSIMVYCQLSMRQRIILISNMP